MGGCQTTSITEIRKRWQNNGTLYSKDIALLFADIAKKIEKKPTAKEFMQILDLVDTSEVFASVCFEQIVDTLKQAPKEVKDFFVIKKKIEEKKYVKKILIQACK